MQRRAAAAYVAVFLLVAAGSYGLIATAQQPQIDLAQSEVDHEVTQGGTLTVGDTTYTVDSIEASDGTVAASLAYNATVEKTRDLQNGSVVERDDANWTVVIPNESDVSTFRLVENFTVDRPTVTQDGTTYVVIEDEGNNRTLVPQDEYLRQKYGEPRTQEFTEGDAWNDTRTVSNVTRERARLSWEAVEPQSTSAAEGANVTLGDTTYVAHFPNNGTLQLTTNYEAYQKDEQAIADFRDRKNGLWMVSILSGIAAVVLLALAYLPTKAD